MKVIGNDDSQLSLQQIQQNKSEIQQSQAAVIINQRKKYCCIPSMAALWMKLVLLFLLITSLLMIVGSIIGFQIDSNKWKASKPIAVRVAYPIELVLGLLELLFILMKSAILLRSLKIDNWIITLQISIIVLQVIFVAWVEAILFILKTNPSKQFCESYKYEIWSHKFVKLYEFGVSYFCSSACTCYVQDVTQFQGYVAGFFNGGLTYDSTYGQVNLVNCDGIVSHSLDQHSLYQLKYLEASLECSGICEPLNYYVFTDVNNGVPAYPHSCFHKVADLLTKDIALISTFPILTSVLLIILFSSFMYLRHQFLTDPLIANNKQVQNLSQVSKIVVPVEKEQQKENSSILNENQVNQEICLSHLLNSQTNWKIQPSIQNSSNKDSYKDEKNNGIQDNGSSDRETKNEMQNHKSPYKEGGNQLQRKQIPNQTSQHKSYQQPQQQLQSQYYGEKQTKNELQNQNLSNRQNQSYITQQPNQSQMQSGRSKQNQQQIQNQNYTPIKRRQMHHNEEKQQKINQN